MKRNVFFILLFLLVMDLASAQGRYRTKTGTIDFEASVPSFEEVAASNQNVSAILNAETGEIAVLALIRGFRFKVALMEEHFNENYAESDKYPKATFKGRFQNFDINEIDATDVTLDVKGIIEMHGVEKEVEVPMNLKRSDGKLVIQSNFTLRPEDFDIEIPKVVSNKIAETVKVSCRFSLSK